METQDLRLFAQVVSTGNFSEAGRALELSPAVVSKRIARLERNLGVRLLQRTTRRVALTPEGTTFHRHALRMLADLEAAEDALARGTAAPRGQLRVTAPASFGRLHIAPLVGPFLARYPEVELDLSLTDGVVDLLEEGLDLAIRIDQPRDSSLIARRIAPNRRLLCAAPSYLQAHGTPAHPEDLATHNCLTLHHQSVWTLESRDGEHRVRVSGNLRTNNAEVLREAVLAGTGIARKSTWDVGDLLRSGALVPVLPDYDVSTHMAIYALYPSARFLAPRVRAFIEFLSEAFGDPPYWEPDPG